MIPYLTGGESPTAARMNALYDAFEAKLEKLLVGKSPFLSPRLNNFGNTAQGYGRVLFFNGAGQRVYTPANNYNHFYASALANNPPNVQLFDAELGLVGVSQQPYGVIDFSQSLQVHTAAYQGVQYPICFIPIDPAQIDIYKNSNPTFAATIIGNYVNLAQKVDPFGVLDIVCENNTALTWPAIYNKHRFIRVHNMSREPMSFISGAQTIAIPKYECVALFREMPQSPWVQHGKYFWNFESGEPRLRWLGGTSEANNTCNPRIAVRWIDQLTQAVPNEFGFIVDQSVLPDFSSQYLDKFADPNNGATKIGDLVHHKGKILLMKTPTSADPTATEINYEGRNKLRQNFEAAGLTVDQAADGTYTIYPPAGPLGMDMVAVSTNLFKQATVQRPVVTMNEAVGQRFVLENTVPVNLDALINPRALDVLPTSLNWQNQNGETVSVNANYSIYALQAFPVVSLTMEQSVQSAKAAIAAAGLTDSTGGCDTRGFRYSGELRIAIDYPLSAESQTQSFPSDCEITSGFTVSTRNVRLTGQGWPDFDTYALPTGQGNPPGNWYFFSPKAQAEFTPIDIEIRNASPNSSPFSRFSSGDFTFQAQEDGFTFNGITTPIIATEYSILQSVVGDVSIFGITNSYPDQYLLNHNYRFPSDVVPEVLAGYTTPGTYAANRIRFLTGSPSGQNYFGSFIPFYTVFLRVPLSVEHYNDIAWKINRLTKCVPIRITDIRYKFGSSYRTLGGLTDTRLNTRPMDSWIRVAPDSDSHNFLVSLDLEIRTEEDFPPQWQNYLGFETFTSTTFKAQVAYSRGGYQFEQESEDSYIPKVLMTTATPSIIVTGSQSITRSAEWLAIRQEVFGADSQYLWLTVDDVKEFAEQEGFPFIYHQIGRPTKLGCYADSVPEGVKGVSEWQSTAPFNNPSGQPYRVSDPAGIDAQFWIDNIYGIIPESGIYETGSSFGVQFFFHAVGAELDKEDFDINDTDAQWLSLVPPAHTLPNRESPIPVDELRDYRDQHWTDTITIDGALLNFIGPAGLSIVVGARAFSQTINNRNFYSYFFGEFNNACLFASYSTDIVNDSQAAVMQWWGWKRQFRASLTYPERYTAPGGGEFIREPTFIPQSHFRAEVLDDELNIVSAMPSDASGNANGRVCKCYILPRFYVDLSAL